MFVIAVIVAWMADRPRRTSRRYAALFRRASERLLTVQEDERRRIARELHDGVGQVLTALTLTLDAEPAPMSATTAARGSPAGRHGTGRDAGPRRAAASGAPGRDRPDPCPPRPRPPGRLPGGHRGRPGYHRSRPALAERPGGGRTASSRRHLPTPLATAARRRGPRDPGAGSQRTVDHRDRRRGRVRPGRSDARRNRAGRHVRTGRAHRCGPDDRSRDQVTGPGSCSGSPSAPDETT